MFKRKAKPEVNPELLRVINSLGAPPVSKSRPYIAEVLNDVRQLDKDLRIKGEDAIRLLEVAERRRFNDLIEGVVVPIAEAFQEAPADRSS